MAETEISRLSVGIEADTRPLEAALRSIEQSTASLTRKLEKGFRFLDVRIGNFKKEFAAFEAQAAKSGTLLTNILESLGNVPQLVGLGALGKELKDLTADSTKLKAELDRLSEVGLLGLVAEFKELESRIDVLRDAAEEGLSGVDTGPGISTIRTEQGRIVGELEKRIEDFEDSIDKQIAPSGAIAGLGAVEGTLKRLEAIRDALEQIRNVTDDPGIRSLIDNSPLLPDIPRGQSGALETPAAGSRRIQVASSGTGFAPVTNEVDALEEAHGSLTAAVERSGRALGEQAGAMRSLDNAARDLGFTFASSFEDAVVEGRRLSDVLQGLERDILRILTRKLVTEPLAGAVTGLIGSAGGASFASLFHGGGRVGSTPVSGRVVPAALFAQAPRFAGGGMIGRVPRLAPGEVPAILHRGEIVRTPAQEAALRHGAGGSGDTRIVVNIQTPDPRAFNESRGQIQAMLADAVRAGRRFR